MPSQPCSVLVAEYPSRRVGYLAPGNDQSDGFRCGKGGPLVLLGSRIRRERWA